MLAGAYLLLQPWLERSVGINLPGLSDLVLVEAEPEQKVPAPTPSKSPDGEDIEQILNGSSRETFVSSAGLRYTRGSVHGHRLKHLMAHTHDDPDRPGSHGVFDQDDPAAVIALVDEAYRQALESQNTQTEHEQQRTIYTVNLGRRIGYIGGESGNRRGRPAARHLRLVLEGKDFITAFPFQP